MDVKPVTSPKGLHVRVRERYEGAGWTGVVLTDFVQPAYPHPHAPFVAVELDPEVLQRETRRTYGDHVPERFQFYTWEALEVLPA